MATIPLSFVEFFGNANVPVGLEGHKATTRIHDMPDKPGPYDLLLHTSDAGPWTVSVRQREGGSARVAVIPFTGGVQALWPKDNVWPPGVALPANQRR